VLALALGKNGYLLLSKMIFITIIKIFQGNIFNVHLFFIFWSETKTWLSLWTNHRKNSCCCKTPRSNSKCVSKLEQASWV